MMAIFNEHPNTCRIAFVTTLRTIHNGPLSMHTMTMLTERQQFIRFSAVNSNITCMMIEVEVIILLLTKCNDHIYQELIFEALFNTCRLKKGEKKTFSIHLEHV